MAIARLTRLAAAERLRPRCGRFRPPLRAAAKRVWLAALIAAGPATRPATRPTVAYLNGEYAFRLDRPADWIVPDHPDEGQVFTVYLPLHRPGAGAGKLHVGGVGLRVEQARPGITDKQAVRDLTGLMAANLFADEHLNARHVSVVPVKVGDLIARGVRFVAPDPDDGNRPVTVEYVVAVRKGTEYVFAAAAPADQFDRLWPQVEAMLATFETTQ